MWKVVDTATAPSWGFCPGLGSGQGFADRRSKVSSEAAPSNGVGVKV